jgi:hypothetical protein
VLPFLACEEAGASAAKRAAFRASEAMQFGFPVED